METVITAIVDEFQLIRYKFGKVTVTAVCCVILFLTGLPQCTRVRVIPINTSSSIEKALYFIPGRDFHYESF